MLLPFPHNRAQLRWPTPPTTPKTVLYGDPFKCRVMKARRKYFLLSRVPSIFLKTQNDPQKQSMQERPPTPSPKKERHHHTITSSRCPCLRIATQKTGAWDKSIFFAFFGHLPPTVQQQTTPSPPPSSTAGQN